MRKTSAQLIAAITSSVLLLVLASISIGATAYAGYPIKLADADKAEILRSVLRRELGKTRRTEVETILLLNNENIKQDWLPAIPNVRFALINADEIKAQRATASGVSFYFISKLEAQGLRVIVKCGKADEHKRGSSSSGSVYQYRKVSGRWRGKQTEGFGSCTAPAQEPKASTSNQ